MNPWAVLILAIAGVLIVAAVKGTQDNLISAALGRPYGNSTLHATKQPPMLIPTGPTGSGWMV